MLDQLPLELIQLIVRLALPAHYSPSTYRERQDTLLALCKTSRLLRTIAQPVLFEVVQLKGVEGVERFVEGVKDEALGKRVRSLRLSKLQANEGEDEDGDNSAAEQDDPFHAALLTRLFSHCPGTVELRLVRVELLMHILEELPVLRRLIVSHGYLASGPSFTLPRLEEFSTFCATVEKPVLNSPSYLSLQSLHIQLDDTASLPNNLFRDFLPQLDCLSIDGTDLTTTQERPRQDGPVLADYTPPRLEARGPHSSLPTRAIRILPYAGEPGVLSRASAEWLRGESFVTALADLHISFANGAARPALLILPTTLDPSSLDVESPMVKFASSFLRTCASRGIEVIFEPTPDPFFDSLVSPEFWRRGKALKAKAKKEEGKKANKGEADDNDGKEE